MTSANRTQTDHEGDHSWADTLSAGGDGKDGTLNVINATGDPVFEVNVRGPDPRVKTSQLRLGARALPGFLGVEDGEDDTTTAIDGKKRHLTLGGRGKSGNGSSGNITLNDADGDGTVQINAGFSEKGVDMLLGAANKPARVHLTTGGNPVPTIEVDGRNNTGSPTSVRRYAACLGQAPT
jgi:hypothetical protein